MAEFRQLIITNKGQALMAKMIAGTGNVHFTKIATSSNTYTDAQILALTSLGNVKQTTLVSKVIRTNNVAVQVEGAVTNAQLSTGYTMNTIALYALDPDDGEIIYAACGASSPGYMPPYNGITTSGAFFKLVTTVGNAENITLNVDPAAVATIGDIQDLQKQISDLQSYVGYTASDIVGVEVDFKNRKFTRLAGAINRTAGAGFDDIKAFGGRKRCNVTDTGKVVAYHGDVGYSETGVLTQAIDLNPVGTVPPDPTLQFPVGTKVQVMVEQPKFYYKVVPLELEKIENGKGFHMRKVRYYISDTKKTGFKLHPAFKRNNVEKNFIYLSAYEGCLFDTTAGAYILDDSQVYASNDVLSSISNAKPASGRTQSLTRGVVRSLASARGLGWSQQTVQSASATEMLFLVEYASFDMQSKIGAGVTNKPWLEDGVNYSEVTGATTNLGNVTGAVTNVNGFNVISYRGEENFFGNIWKFVDGININAKGIHEAYIADNNFADDKLDGVYSNAGITLAKTNGYVSAFGYNEDYDWLFLASETLGNSSLPVGDYFYQNNTYNGGTGIMIARLGGSWNDGANAGGFYWSVSSVSGSLDRDFGGRLLYVPQ